MGGLSKRMKNMALLAILRLLSDVFSIGFLRKVGGRCITYIYSRGRGGDTI